MSSLNDSFHSPLGPWFWEEPDHAVKERIKNKIVEDSKKGIRTGVILILLSLLVSVYGIFMETDSKSFFDMFEKCLFISFPVLTICFFGGAVISSVHYRDKAKEGRFLCRHVIIENKQITTNGLTNHLVVWIRSDDERMDQATVDMEVYASNRLGIGQQGVFVMIEDEKRKAMVSPFWFIPDMDLRDPFEEK